MTTRRNRTECKGIISPLTGTHNAQCQVVTAWLILGKIRIRIPPDVGRGSLISGLILNTTSTVIGYGLQDGVLTVGRDSSITLVQTLIQLIKGLKCRSMKLTMACYQENVQNALPVACATAIYKKFNIA
jgi:hypothetical protein